MTPQKNKLLVIISLLLAAVAVAFRASHLHRANIDMAVFNLQWYQTLVDQGIARTLATDFTNYNPPYSYLLALATLTQGFLSPLVAIKLIPTFFDLCGAFLVYKLTKLEYREHIPFLAATAYFAAPSIMLNSSYWGQVDSLYVFFLLLSLYYLLTEKPFAALLAFGLSFSVKAQAVFFLPFLAVMFFQGRITLKHFFVIPLVYIAAVLPVIILGRPVKDAFLVYFQQSDTYHRLSMNAPNLYHFLPNEWYSWAAPVGMGVTLLGLGYWIYKASTNGGKISRENIVLAALASVALTPFLLPKMHDRYFYPADVLSIVAAFYNPQLWFLPILYQVISTFAISGFLFNADSTFVAVAALVNAVTISFIPKRQGFFSAKKTLSKTFAVPLSWLYSSCISAVILGACVMLVFQPVFVRIEYERPGFPADQTMTKSERYERAVHTLDYLTQGKKDAYLSRLKSDNGAPVFTKVDIKHLSELRQTLNKFQQIHICLTLALLVATLLAWIGGRLKNFIKDILISHWGTTVLTTAFGVAAMVAATMIPHSNLGFYSDSEAFQSLFPPVFWMDAAMVTLAILIIGRTTLSVGARFYFSHLEEKK